MITLRRSAQIPNARVREIPGANIFYLDITNKELQSYMEEVIGTDNPLQLVTPELFGLANNDDRNEDSEDSEEHLIVDADDQIEDANDQIEGAEESTRTSPQY